MRVFPQEPWPAGASATEQRQSRLVVDASLAFSAIATAFSLLYVLEGFWLLIGFNTLATIAFLTSIPATRRFGPTVGAHLVTVGGWLCLTASLLMNGGFHAQVVMWLAVIPLVGGMLGGMRAGVAWTAITAATILGMWVVELAGATPTPLIPVELASPMLLAQRLGVVGVIGITVGVFRRNQRWSEDRADEALGVLRHEVEHRRQAQERATAANQTKTNFLATMSHELRTPLNAILGYTELLQEKAKERGDPSDLADLGAVLTAGTQLRTMIDDVLDLSKLEAGHMLADWADIDLPDFVEELRTTIEPLARQNGNQVTVDIAHAPPRLCTDRRKLRQTLLNLLGNAAKFTSDGAVHLTVQMSGTDIVWEVRDDGIGVPPDKLDVIFQSFQQADPSSTRRYGGTGLGLTLASRFVTLLGGSIRIVSEVGVGSVFSVVLPTRANTLGSLTTRR